MRKDSIAIGGLTLLITAAVVGGAWYYAQRQPPAPDVPQEPSWTTLEPGAAGNAQSFSDVSAETSSARTNRILECNHPELGKFYTNAASCEQADVHNRLSIAQPLVSAQQPRPYSGDSYQTPAQQAESARKKSPQRKPSLQLAGKSPPSGLNQACTFAVGKALEIERVLGAADNPMTSRWRNDYCRWRCDAVKEECAVPDSYFYYRYQRLCPDEYRNGC